MSKVIKKHWLSIVTFISALATVLAICYFAAAEDNGTRLGCLRGETMGSINGFFDGKSVGEEEGKAAGLSAEDTTADINGFFERAGDMGVLQVLSASVDMTNSHSIGDGDYAAIYHMMGKAVFTVDFNNAQVVDSGDKVMILIPVPEVKVEIDETKTDKLAENQKWPFTGKATDGYAAYVNSAKAVISNSKEAIANYNTLMDMAKKSALSTVQRLAENVSVEKREVIVTFIEEVKTDE